MELIIISVLTIALGIVSLIAFLGNRELKRVRGELDSTKKALAGRKRDPSEIPTESKTSKSADELFNGYVTKEIKKQSGGSLMSFNTTDKMPKFNNVDSAISWLDGLLSSPDDPTLMNLSGFGMVMKTEQYMALGVIVRNVIRQIGSLHNKDTNTDKKQEAENGTEDGV